MMTRCTACNDNAPILFRTRDWNRRINEKLFLYHQCVACGLVFLSPVPADLGMYYPKDYYSLPSTNEELARAAELERYKIDIVTRFAVGDRLLEIGPAYGSFLYLAKQAHFAPEAIEMDPECCNFIRNVVGVPVVASNDPVRSIRDSGPYDVIALWHVIEHLPRLWDSLTAIADRLKPGGILVIAAPNPASLQFRIQGGYWPHIDAPRHVLLVPSSLLAERLRPLGLTTEWETTDDAGARSWNSFGWEFFFMNFSQRNKARKFLRLLGSLFTAAFAPWERKEGKGSAYTIVFRKERSE